MVEPRPVWTALAGVALVIVGILFLASPVFSTLAVGLTWGVLLVVGGLIHAIQAVVVRDTDWGWGLVGGVLAGVAGVLLLLDPLEAVLGLTLVLALYLVAAGCARLFGAAALPFARWALVWSGVTSLVLGILVAARWPASGLVTFGVFLGIDTIVAGFARIGLAATQTSPESRPPLTPRTP